MPRTVASQRCHLALRLRRPLPALGAVVNGGTAPLRPSLSMCAKCTASIVPSRARIRLVVERSRHVCCLVGCCLVCCGRCRTQSRRCSVSRYCMRALRHAVTAFGVVPRRRCHPALGLSRSSSKACRCWCRRCVVAVIFAHTRNAWQHQFPFMHSIAL